MSRTALGRRNPRLAAPGSRQSPAWCCRISWRGSRAGRPGVSWDRQSPLSPRRANSATAWEAAHPRGRQQATHGRRAAHRCASVPRAPGPAPRPAPRSRRGAATQSPRKGRLASPASADGLPQANRSRSAARLPTMKVGLRRAHRSPPAASPSALARHRRCRRSSRAAASRTRRPRPPPPPRGWKSSDRPAPREPRHAETPRRLTLCRAVRGDHLG